MCLEEVLVMKQYMWQSMLNDQEYTAYFGAEKNQVTDLLSGAIINLDGGLKMAPYSAYFLA